MLPQHSRLPSSLGLASRQRGAGLIYMFFFLFSFSLMGVLTTNIAQLVYEKMRLQVAVDQAALAAANIQSIGLNEIADLNNAAIEEWDWAERILLSGPPFLPHDGSRAERYFEAIFDNIQHHRHTANEEYALLAHEYADAAITHNFGLNHELALSQVEGASNERLMVPEEIEGRIVFTEHASWCTLPPWLCPPPKLAKIFQSSVGTSVYSWPGIRGRNRAYGQVTSGLFIGTTVHAVDAIPFWAKLPPVTYAAYELKQAAKPFAAGPGVFGLEQPELRVYASAKPTQGNIAAGRPEYLPILKGLNYHDALPAVPQLDRVTH